jgi:zinc protease
MRAIAALRALPVMAVVFTLILIAQGQANENAGQSLNVVKVVSPGGIEAWLVSDHINPIINVRFAFKGGASLDPEGKEGLASMVSSLLDEGAADLDSQSFQRRLEDLSITVRFDAGRDTFRGRMKTLSENKDQAFALLAAALNAPRFDEEPVKRIRGQILAGLRNDLEDPDSVAGLTLAKEIFPDHPYGRPVEGTLGTIPAITTDDLKIFVAERMARDNLIIAVVGDIKPDELSRRLDKVFLPLPAISKPATIKEARPQITGGTKVIKMAVPQSAIVFAQKGPKRDDPDFYTVFVLNHILGGGGFTSRLYDEIREKRGLAYSIGSYLYPLERVGLIQGYGGTANKRVGETLKVLKSEWRRMAEKGTTAEVLADTKTFLTGSFPLRLTSSGRIASILVSMQLEELGIDYLARRNKFIEQVTLQDVNRLAKTVLDPDNLVVVVVGAPEGVASTR